MRTLLLFLISLTTLSSETNLIRCVEANEEKILNLKMMPSDKLLNANLIVSAEWYEKFLNMYESSYRNSVSSLEEIRKTTLGSFFDEVETFEKIAEIYKNIDSLDESTKETFIIIIEPLQATLKGNMKLVREQSIDICYELGVY